MAETAELQKNVAAGVAHDLNNQVMLILNHLEASDLDGAKRAAARCSELTKGLLSWCRGDSPDLCALDPVRWLTDFGNSLRLPERVALRMTLPQALPEILADSAALSRIFTNLIGNALEAMGDTGRIRITAGAGFVQLQDSGPGIPLSNRDRIFEPFFTTKGARGTGLGLCIVQDLMRQMGGSVRLLQTTERGACFELRFRLADQRRSRSRS